MAATATISSSGTFASGSLYFAGADLTLDYGRRTGRRRNKETGQWETYSYYGYALSGTLLSSIQGIYSYPSGVGVYGYGNFNVTASCNGQTATMGNSFYGDLNGYLMYWPEGVWVSPPTMSSPMFSDPSALFNSSNATTRTLSVYFSVGTYLSDAFTIKEADGQSGTGFPTPTGALGYLSTITLNAPPDVTHGNITFNIPKIYAGYTTANVNISSLGAKLGGNISSVVFRIGDQTDTKITTGKYSIALNTPGIFKPTITVTDSRNQTTTKTLSDIVVLPYVYPDITYETTRVKPDMTPDDEGSCILVKSNFTYTSDVETLVEPTVVVKDSSNNTVSVITKWFDNYDTQTDTYIFNFSAVSNPIGNPSTKGYYELVNNNYILSTDTSVVTGKTYYAIDDEVDWNDTSDWESPKKLSALIYGFNDIQHSYQLSITPSDTTHSGNANIQTVGSAYYTVDFYAGGHGVAFGKAAVRDGFECGMPATFNDDIKLTIDENAAPGTLDGNLYAALVERGWITPSS